MRRVIWGWLLLVCLLGAVPAQAADYSFQDDSGRQVTIKAPYRRVISLYGAHSENLFALGLDQEIVGVSPGETYPPQALAKPVFSYHDDPERFLAARPDLVLIRPMVARAYPALVARLEQAGIAVVSLQPTTVEDMYLYWERLGKLTGHEAQAESLAAYFRKGLAEMTRRVAQVPPDRRPLVYFESIHDKMKTFAPDSMAIFALTAAGGVNAAADAQAVRGTNIAEYGKEHILAQGARIDVYLAQVGTMNKVTPAQIAQESGFKAIKAVAQGRVHLIDEQLVSRPTPRLLEGIRILHALLYPGPAAAGEARP
jgi:iron complex transport system substrate-binding protein